MSEWKLEVIADADVFSSSTLGEGSITWLPAQHRAVVEGSGVRNVIVSTIATPRARYHNTAVVQVLRAGLCGSDIHSYAGREEGLAEGCVRGHEMAGRIVELSDDLKITQQHHNLRLGQLVFTPFSTTCGQCVMCRANLPSRCLRGRLFGWRTEQCSREVRYELEGCSLGEGLDGAQAQYVLVPDAATSLVPIPTDLCLEEAVLCADILPTGFYCAANGGVGDWSAERAGTLQQVTRLSNVIVVVGCGPVGLCALACVSYLLRDAPQRDAVTVFAVDLVEKRLELAEKLGARPIRCSAGVSVEELLSPVLSASGGLGADIVLEAVGNTSALELAYAAVRAGGVLSSIGVHTEPFALSPEQFYDKNLTYRAGRCPVAALVHHTSNVLRHTRSALGVDLMQTIVSHVAPLDDAPELYRRFCAREVGMCKVMFAPHEHEDARVEGHWVGRGSGIVDVGHTAQGGTLTEETVMKWLEQSDGGQADGLKWWSALEFRFLAMIGCGVTRIQESLLASPQLRYLEELALDHNNLESLPQTIGELTHLRALQLHDNAFETLCDEMAKLQRLEVIRLDRNKFTVFPAVLLKLPALRVLHIDENEISLLPVDWKVPAASLREVLISRNPLQRGELSRLAALCPAAVVC